MREVFKEEEAMREMYELYIEVQWLPIFTLHLSVVDVHERDVAWSGCGGTCSNIGDSNIFQQFIGNNSFVHMTMTHVFIPLSYILFSGGFIMASRAEPLQGRIQDF